MFDDSDVADEITLSGLDQLCMDLSDLREKIDEVKNTKSGLDQEYEELSRKICSYLNAHDKPKYETPLGTFTVTKRLSYKTPKMPEEREAFFQYLKDKGHFDDLITVNSQTLNAYAKREIETAAEEGKEDFELPGLGEPSLYERVTIRRKK